MQGFDAAVASVAPAALAEELERGDRLRLVDVREPLEGRIASLAAAELVPLGTLPDAMAAFDRDEDIVVMCHHGIRSQMACEFLVQSGFTRVRNLSGGIDRWALEVDPTVPRY
jgi:rhodanese-related sulfurtransferase